MPSLLSDAYTGVPAGGFVSWPGGIGAPHVPIPLRGGKRRRTQRHSKKRVHTHTRTMRKRRHTSRK